MKTILSIRFTITIFLIYLYDNINVCAELLKPSSDLLDRVQQVRHWQWMWFSEFGDANNWMPLCRIWCADPTLDAVDRLRLVSPMMGCAYGLKLNWFLSLTFVTIDECHTMQQSNNKFTEDCIDKLGKAIEKVNNVIGTLMNTLEYIDSVIHDDISQNQFYQQLVPLEIFFTRLITLLSYGLYGYPNLEGEDINRSFNQLSGFLRWFLLSTCQPDYQFFDLTAIRNEFVAERYPNGIYSFYVDVLHTYTDYINNHLRQLELLDD